MPWRLRSGICDSQSWHLAKNRRITDADWGLDSAAGCRCQVSSGTTGLCWNDRSLELCMLSVPALGSAAWFFWCWPNTTAIVNWCNGATFNRHLLSTCAQIVAVERIANPLPSLHIDFTKCCLELRRFHRPQHLRSFTPTQICYNVFCFIWSEFVRLIYCYYRMSASQFTFFVFLPLWFYRFERVRSWIVRWFLSQT